MWGLVISTVISAVGTIIIAGLLGEDNYGSIPVEEAGKKSKMNLDRALQLDQNNAEALAGMGLYVSNHEIDHEKSIDLLRRALAINPGLVNASTWLATELDAVGNLRAGIQLREQTFQRDPLHRPTFGNLQQSYMVMGQNEKAMEMLDSLQAHLPGDAKLIGDYGEANFMAGHLAEAQVQFQQAYDKEPLDSVNRFWYGLTLLHARKYELITKIAPQRITTLALSRLGRVEEALILGNREISKGQNTTAYFQALVENQRFAELVNVLESRWSDLDGYSRNWPGRSGYGHDSMGYIAQAYRKLGNDTKFDDAMSRFKASLDAQLTEGADNWVLNRSRAHYAVLANDYEGAISLLEKAFEQGAYIDTVNATAWPVFKPLNGDPRYEAVKAKMVARLNEELEKMDFSDLETEHGS